MATIIPFPKNDERKWSGVANELSKFLLDIGAREQDLKYLLDRLRIRWDGLGKPFDLKINSNLVGPLTQEQLQSVDGVIKEVIQEFTAHLMEEHALTIFEFARLELELHQSRHTHAD